MIYQELIPVTLLFDGQSLIAYSSFTIGMTYILKYHDPQNYRDQNTKAEVTSVRF